MPASTATTLPSAGQQQVFPPAFHMMLKPRGAICNLDCQYCYYLAKERLDPGSRFRMADDLLAEYTRQYIAAQFGEYGQLRMIRTRSHKLVRRYPAGPHELFDLLADPLLPDNY